MLPQPILVSDKQPVQGFYYDCFINKVKNTNGAQYAVSDITKQIIAGIPELPSINFSALSEEDCKRIGRIENDKLLKEYLTRFPKQDNGISKEQLLESFGFEIFKEGFKVAQSLNEKKFSEENMKRTWQEGCKAMRLNAHRDGSEFNFFEDFLKSLSQPKQFSVELEMGLMRLNSDGEKIGFPNMSEPKITNDSVKITKLL